MKNNPITFFIKNSNYKIEEITQTKHIHKGFTNESFLIKTKDELKWQVRFAGLNDIVIRSNEKKVLDLINDNNFIYYDDEGNSIKKWIDGKNLSLFFNKKKKLKLICNKINILHSLNIDNKNIVKNDYLIYLDRAKNIDLEIKNKYIELIKKYEYLQTVLSHNDLSPANIIYDGRDIHFIDYEWSRINDNYFDIANFIRESNLNLKWLDFLCNNLDNVEKEILKDFLFIVTCFAFQWTFISEVDKKIIKYRKKCFKKMNMLYKKIIYNGSS